MKHIKKSVIYVILVMAVLTYSCKSSGKDTVTSFSGSFVEKGKPVADLADFRIAYYEPVPASEAVFSAGEGGAYNVQESDEPFVITGYGPSDELPREITKPSIYVVFSQPVVPLAQLGQVIRENAQLFKIEPHLQGVYRWYGTKLLSFEPDTDSLPQQRYTITVSDRIKSLGGKTLEGERSFSFETERLSVLDWQLGEGSVWVNTWNADPEEAKYIRMVFSHPVNLQEIAKWIEVSANGRLWPFSLSRFEKLYTRRYRPEQCVLLTINAQLPLNTAITMILKEGARSEPGWLGTKAAASWNYHTLQPLKFTGASARSQSRPRTEESDSIPVSLSFSHDVEPQEIEKYFSIEGMPALKKENVRVYGSTVVIVNMPLEYERNYFVRISDGLKDLYGRAVTNPGRIEVITGKANSYVYIQNSGSRMLEAGFPPIIVWEAQNPVSVRTLIQSAGSSYERLPLTGLRAMDASAFPANSKRYFFEDLSPFLNAAGKGTAALRWEYQTLSSWQPGRIDTANHWLTVQVTNIGITVRYAYNTVLVWATHLSDGSPVADAVVELMEGEKSMLSGQTNRQGLAVFDFAALRQGSIAALFTQPRLNYRLNEAVAEGFRIRVTEGQGSTKDTAEFTPNDSHNRWRFGIGAWESPFTVERERPVIFMFTDRGIYRPGETVTFRGVDRSLKTGIYRAYNGQYKIEVGTGGYQAPVIAELSGLTTANGGSFGSFTLPENLEPGQYRIVYRRPRSDNAAENNEATSSVSFTVANFERLRFQASVNFPDVVYYHGDRLAASVSASWLSGGGLSGAPYTWYMTREPAAFVPASAENVWRNWRFGPENNDGRYYIGQGEGVLGPDGKAEITQDIGDDGIEGAVYSYRLEASVQDAARQEISARSSVLVHPASFYIAARVDSGTARSAANTTGSFAVSGPSAYFLTAGRSAYLSWVLVTPEGSPYQPVAGQSGELTIQVIRHEWKQARQAGVGGRINLIWERVEEVVEEQVVKIEAGRGGFISGVRNFTPNQSGLWEVRIKGRDQKNRIASTSFRFYVSGAGWVRWDSEDVDAISLVTDKQSYAPGETAKILVRSPLERGSYLLTLEREGIISQKIIELEGSALTIDVPIEESYLPIVYAALSSYTVRRGPPENTYYEPDLDKPKGVFGVTPIYVDSQSRNYRIEIQSSSVAYRPAEQAEVKIKVTLNGRPAPATEVSFMAVDRGVVDLINYHVPDPVAFFYDPRHFPLGVRGADSRSLLIDPVTYSLSDLQGGDNEEDLSKIDERKDFRPTAVFEPYLLTGPDGTVTVKFNLPDSLTTYRCTAIAVGLNNFGIMEQDLRVSAPLTAVAALPRKLRWRDTGTVSMILTNLENAPVEASVSLAAENETGDEAEGDSIIEVDGESVKTVRILPGASQEVRFRVAAVGAGTARLVFTLRSPQVNERIIKTLLVDRPSLMETVATIGSLRGDASFMEEGIVLPSLVPVTSGAGRQPGGTGALSVSLSASRLASLKETARYLLNYPYGCNEQKTSRLIPIIAFGEYLGAFDLDSPLFGRPDARNNRPINPQAIVEAELAEIAKSQLDDGSFPYWPGGAYGDAFVSLRVAHIVVLIRGKGWQIPSSLNVQKLFSYIAAVSSQQNHYANTDPFVKGYSLWVRSMYGERISLEVSAYLRRGDELGISGWAFGGLAALELGQRDMAVSARDRVRRFIRPGTRTLDLTDTYERQGNFWCYDTDRYALALMLFVSLNADDDMTTRLANSLLERQRGGIWQNTVSSFWATLAFGMVADSESRQWTDKLEGRVSLGGTTLLDTVFSSYGGVPASFNSSLDALADLPHDVLLPMRIERTGPGPLYYTASLSYGIPTELASARDEGLCVFTETYDSDGNLISGGRLVAGKTYTRKIIVSSSRDRTFVALRVPVPSGAEIVDSVFVTSSTVPPAENNVTRIRYNAPVRYMLDDEARFHWDYFRAGRQEIEFRFRAVMPGVYPTPPASAECMYETEVFGRSSGELIRIE